MRFFFIACLAIYALPWGVVAQSSGTAKQGAHAPAGANRAESPDVPLPSEPGVYAVINTSMGSIVCRLFEKEAPKTVANFRGLATGTKPWTDPATGKVKHTPLYNGTTFHRVIPGFMIQGGDPKGDGTGDPGYKFKNEVSSDLQFDRPGRLAYANAGPGTNGSQFFITEVATPHLNGSYTLFGQCDDATVALVKQIAHMATDPTNDRPFRPVKILHIKITHGATSATTAKSTMHAKKAEGAAPSSPDK
jgi:peptidyl-prolyl cis-trans isomerase A (cyclophilin A)